MKFPQVFINLSLLALLLQPIPLFHAPGAAAADFPSIAGPCGLEFPRDHGGHPDFRTEWWYYTGNLHSDSGERFGFQLTFFRVRTTPPAADGDESRTASAWRTSQVFAAHAAVSNLSGKLFVHAEKMARAALGMAGNKNDRDTFVVWVDDWLAFISPGDHRLFCSSPDFSFQLDLVPLKKPVSHGDSGYSRKGDNPEEASCYYSVTRLQAGGKIRIGDRDARVYGSAWMDHEFSSAPLSPKLAGWDWFSLQFEDGSDLMIYLMREKDGRFSPVSSGTFIGKDGRTVHLSSSDFRIEPLKTWKSPHSGATYPAAWLLEVVPIDLKLEIQPNLADQEMQTPESTRVTYWEGSVSARGTAGQGRTVSAEGYVELTGYSGEKVF